MPITTEDFLPELREELKNLSREYYEKGIPCGSRRELEVVHRMRKVASYIEDTFHYPNEID